MNQKVYPGTKITLKKPSEIKNFEIYPEDFKLFVLTNQDKEFTIEIVQKISARYTAYKIVEQDRWLYYEFFNVVSREELSANEVNAFMSLI